jgi:SpoVK/Ycf46/Vps4 family AAA+-type ATPase
MPRQQLNRALAALHQELESGAEIEAEDREALLQAVREIEDALSQGEPGNEPPAGGPLSRRITALIEDFETSHPKFAEILSSVSESLANLGI